jgi:hypothetical protein
MSPAGWCTDFSYRLLRKKLQVVYLTACIQAGVINKTLLLLLMILPLLAASSSQPDAAPGAVRAEMRNVMYHYTEPIAVHISYLKGELEPTQKGGMPIFDDANSFTLAIESARISITTQALANVMNQYALAASDAPIKGLSIIPQGDKLKIKGRLHTKGDLPFESEGSLSLTSEGEIRIHAEKIKAGHLPVKGLMDLLGESIAKLIDTRKVRGLRADKNDLLINPAELFPPPHIQGRLRAISIIGDEVVQEYGTQTPPTIKVSGNYMAYEGAQLHFGKLIMTEADLILLDLDPQDPFDFYLARYREQLVAGYTKTTPSFGLRCYFRDYNKLTAKQKFQ